MELTIGGLAKQAKVNVQTLRYYERIGLLNPHSRSKTGYRFYDHTSLKQLNFILKSKELGFTLKEISDLLTLGADPEQSCEEVQQKAKEKQQEIRHKIASLRQLDHSLGNMISKCKARKNQQTCPILEDLSGD